MILLILRTWGVGMPSIEENLKEWNDDYDWRLGGELWSKA